METDKNKTLSSSKTKHYLFNLHKILQKNKTCSQNIIQTNKIFTEKALGPKSKKFGFVSITSSCDLPFQLKNGCTLSLRK